MFYQHYHHLLILILLELYHLILFYLNFILYILNYVFFIFGIDLFISFLSLLDSFFIVCTLVEDLVLEEMEELVREVMGVIIIYDLLVIVAAKEEDQEEEFFDFEVAEEIDWVTLVEDDFLLVFFEQLRQECFIWHGETLKLFFFVENLFPFYSILL